MSDLFHKDVPEGFLRVAFGLILATPRLTYQVLTKRPERMEQFMRNTTPEQAGQALYAHLRRNFPYAWEAYVKLLDAKAMQGQGPWPPRNAWLGTSVENQEAADERIPHLVNTPAAVRFLSCEPLLGPLDLRKWLVQTDCPRCGNDPEVMACAACRGTGPLRWLIVGGESGPGARPCGVEWLRGVVQQGQATGTATFMKQLGADPRNDGHAWPKDAKGGNMEEWPGDLRVRQYPEEGRVVEVVA
jgi:protein gp37